MVTVTVARIVSISGRVARVEGIPGDVAMLRHVTSANSTDLALVACSDGQAWLVGVLGTVAPPPPPPQPEDGATPAPAPVIEVVTLRPTVSGTWRGSGWRSDTSDLYQGDWTGRGLNRGGAWWGPLPSRIRSGSVLLRRRRAAGMGAAATPTLTLLAGTSRPSGAPTVLASQAGPALAAGASTTWDLPAAWVAQMASGAAGGIGCQIDSAAPYMALAVSDAGMTLTLTTESEGV